MQFESSPMGVRDTDENHQKEEGNWPLAEKQTSVRSLSLKEVGFVDVRQSFTEPGAVLV